VRFASSGPLKNKYATRQRGRIRGTFPRFRSGKRQFAKQIPIIQERSRVIANERILVTLQRFKKQSEPILASTWVEEFSKFDASRLFIKIAPVAALPNYSERCQRCCCCLPSRDIALGPRSIRAAMRETRWKQCEKRNAGHGTRSFEARLRAE